MAKEIPLTRGKVAIVDDNWFDELNKKKWCFDGRYAVRFDYASDKRTKQYMHRVVANADNAHVVDHINGDTLDNREDNVRLCSRKDNNANKDKSCKTTNPYKGVSWWSAGGKWRAYITVEDKQRHLGYYGCEHAAAKAYNVAAASIFGKFARLNVIQDIGA